MTRRVPTLDAPFLVITSELVRCRGIQRVGCLAVNLVRAEERADFIWNRKLIDLTDGIGIKPLCKCARLVNLACISAAKGRPSHDCNFVRMASSPHHVIISFVKNQSFPHLIHAILEYDRHLRLVGASPDADFVTHFGEVGPRPHDHLFHWLRRQLILWRPPVWLHRQDYLRQ